MRLFIAEKPLVANAIAAELGQISKGNGHIICGDDVVTWCFGHMLELAEPDEYTSDEVPRNASDNKIWRIEDLPIIPDEWIINPKKDTEKQLNIIGGLIEQADSVVNAGDPDREGQLLIDEVLVYFSNAKPVKRYWTNAVDPASVKKGLLELKDNEDYKSWGYAAKARQRADWLIGMNLSRAYTLRAQRGGSRVLLTVGRVQTPTLALVVNRDLDIKAFKPIPYHSLSIEAGCSGEVLMARWKAKEDQVGLDDEGRLVDTAIANKLVQTMTEKKGIVSEYKQEKKKKSQPLVHSLASLTLLVSNKFGYGAEDVLKTCQALYEKHKLTSYPRTDCPYLPESQFLESSEVVEAIGHVNKEFSDYIESVDLKIKSKTWNDSKVTAHHGIIPTLHKGDKSCLTKMEVSIYNQIVISYLAQFLPVHEFMKTTVLIEVEGEKLVVHGKVITINGWLDVYRASEETEKKEIQFIPEMTKGDTVQCGKVTRIDSKTKPPSRFTEGTLMQAMINIHKFVDEAEHKKILIEGDGIGTPATQASTISELKRRGFLEENGKSISSTVLGRSSIAALPEAVKSPILTALYERMLKGIEQGKSEMNDFLVKQTAFIKLQVAKANDGSISIAGGGKVVAISTVHKCLACGSGLSRRPSKKKGFWWGCSNYPTCKETYFDIKGKPNYKNSINKSNQGAKHD